MKNVSSRKYCLDCSPFGLHNTAQVHKDRTVDRRCEDCGKEYVYTRSAGHRYDQCNSCAIKKRRTQIKDRAVQLKGGACKLCGYSKCSQAMVFHHIDPNEKDFQISYGASFSWEKVTAELVKCVLLCANCHSEVHAGMITKKLEP